jgi:hypothetical protein
MKDREQIRHEIKKLEKAIKELKEELEEVDSCEFSYKRAAVHGGWFSVKGRQNEFLFFQDGKPLFYQGYLCQDFVCDGHMWNRETFIIHNGTRTVKF